MPRRYHGVSRRHQSRSHTPSVGSSDEMGYGIVLGLVSGALVGAGLTSQGTTASLVLGAVIGGFAGGFLGGIVEELLKALPDRTPLDPDPDARPCWCARVRGDHDVRDHPEP